MPDPETATWYRDAIVYGAAAGAPLLERALRELRHGLTSRPARARVPLRGSLGLLSGGGAHSSVLESARP